MVIGECKIFIGSRGGQGYGRIKYNGKNETVHRIIAHLFLGLDLSDPKQCACHKKECTSRACWNVEHIYVGTHDQNMQDKR
jgi:hypothetical protein